MQTLHANGWNRRLASRTCATDGCFGIGSKLRNRRSIHDQGIKHASTSTSWSRLACNGEEVSDAPSTDDTVLLLFPGGECHAKVGEVVRNSMKSCGVEVYTTWGKVWNCNGAGQCGLCIVQVLDGEECLDEKSDHEKKKLKGKPESYRLACQAELLHPGTVKMQNLPRES